MIGRLRGSIVEKQPPLILIEAHGVGYEVQMPMTCFYALPDLQQEVIVFTHFVVREDAQLLFGFNSKQERAVFRELIKVSGVGPKLALTILSGMSARQFIQVVEQQTLSSLIKLPGVGKKTAERLMVEMKDRLGQLGNQWGDESNTRGVSSSPSSPDLLADVEAEAVSALIALGYKPQEASRMISNVAHPDRNCEALIREALRTAI